MTEEIKKSLIVEAYLTPNLKVGKSYYSKAQIYSYESESELRIDALVGLARFPLFSSSTTKHLNVREEFEKYIAKIKTTSLAATYLNVSGSKLSI